MSGDMDSPPIWPDWADDHNNRIATNNMPVAELQPGDVVNLDNEDEPMSFEVVRAEIRLASPTITTSADFPGGIYSSGGPNEVFLTLRIPMSHCASHVRRRPPDERVTPREITGWMTDQTNRLRSYSMPTRAEWEAFKAKFTKENDA